MILVGDRTGQFGIHKILLAVPHLFCSGRDFWWQICLSFYLFLHSNCSILSFFLFFFFFALFFLFVFFILFWLLLGIGFGDNYLFVCHCDPYNDGEIIGSFDAYEVLTHRVKHIRSVNKTFETAGRTGKRNLWNVNLRLFIWCILVLFWTSFFFLYKYIFYIY